ncbi:MAG: hypothetical protein MZV70_34100 [Desulfobacterales bacterium]|nr:hypothetical protein [Desulfobacterales bacterium]
MREKVDHTGIDIIARNPHTELALVGISVKCRSRSTGTESTHVRIDRGDFNKMSAACEAFDCVPFFAIVVDAADTICGFILSMEHLLNASPARQGVKQLVDASGLAQAIRK